MMRNAANDSSPIYRMTQLDRRILYPPIEPYNVGRLTVTIPHEIYFEESGNPNGKPAVFLHGGPGAGCLSDSRRLFDPDAYRIVLFDQRGSGKSTPHASLVYNTTWHLVMDMEALRQHLGIDRWLVCGGSWGSTLALAYAESHADRTTELILRGIFMLRRKELEWFYQGGPGADGSQGAGALFPDLWEKFVEPIPSAERGDMITAYHRRLTGDDAGMQLHAAKAWSTWEAATLSLLPDDSRVSEMGDDQFALAFARIECHYFLNGGFFDVDDQLLRDIGTVRHIPGVIIQGRYDVVTPAKSAWDLHRAWPEAALRLVQDAGHAQSELGILSELVLATDRFRGARP
jgi:proline iminopeptidase